MEKYDQKVFNRGFFHLGSDIWMINKENKILIQKRSPMKRLEPNVWAMTGGSVIVGENSVDTIVRETKEEIGLDIDANQLKLVTKFRTGTVWIHTYVLRCDYKISEMKFRPEEVSEAKWATWEEIDEIVKKGQFIQNRWNFVGTFLKAEIEGKEINELT